MTILLAFFWEKWLCDSVNLENLTANQSPTERDSSMKQDSQWHDAIVYQHADNGMFVLVENIEEGKKDERPKTMEGGGVKYQDVKYHWNRGQPIVDFGDFKMAITDIRFEKLDETRDTEQRPN